MDRQAQRDIRRKLNCLQFAQECGSVVNTDYRPKQSKTHGMGKLQQNALKILEALAVEYGVDAEPDDPVWIPIARWKQDYADVGTDRKRWPEASNGLQERGLIELAELHARLLP